MHLAGANGSGKTSLLRVLAGLARRAPGACAAPATCAFVPEKVVLASAMRPASGWRRCAACAARAARLGGGGRGLGPDPDVLEHSSATFSKGMLQRIALLEALHADCPLLLLDEPFAGLDPDGRDWVARRLADRARAARRYC